MHATLQKMRRRGRLDFSDYLELRQLLDVEARAEAEAGAEARAEAAEEARRTLAHLERALPVRFARAIPHLVTLADAPEPPPRGLTRDAVRAMFAMRAEFAAHGRARAALIGFSLPDAEGLKDWLDFVENERRHALQVRASLRELDRRIWAVYTGERRMPLAAPMGT
ncbi:MAG TPA: hypothetical protein VFH78_00565 [Candidatus Thermoplasmatota archaeon]|nr:hypothetical protein [Candidatus Thermoplasmatota archaeon]